MIPFLTVRLNPFNYKREATFAMRMQTMKFIRRTHHTSSQTQISNLKPPLCGIRPCCRARRPASVSSRQAPYTSDRSWMRVVALVLVWGLGPFDGSSTVSTVQIRPVKVCAKAPNPKGTWFRTIGREGCVDGHFAD